MRISQLATESGVRLATVKYYLREGLLQPGTSVSATQSDYGEVHLQRLRLIKALTGAVGLPVKQAGAILAIIDEPGGSLFEMLGRAVAALPPYPDDAAGAVPDSAGAVPDSAYSADAAYTANSADGRADPTVAPAPAEAPDYPRAHAALAAIGQIYDPHYPAVAQLERALVAAESAGLPLSAERLTGYAMHLMAIAELDLAGVTGSDPAASVEYAVLGTTLYEPVILALRRLAHQDLAVRRLGFDSGTAPPR